MFRKKLSESGLYADVVMKRLYRIRDIRLQPEKNEQLSMARLMALDDFPGESSIREISLYLRIKPKRPMFHVRW